MNYWVYNINKGNVHILTFTIDMYTDCIELIYAML